jgi:hypothetical protein
MRISLLLLLALAGTIGFDLGGRGMTVWTLLGACFVFVAILQVGYLIGAVVALR